MNRLIFFLFLLCGFSAISARDFQTPLQKNGFTRQTSYDELSEFVQEIDASSPLLTVETAGKSVQGRNIYAMKFSASVFGEDKSRIRVFLFAQQHGNEQSGKEGALLLALELLKPENRYLFDRIDLLLVPQVNPDGSEENRRRNGNDADLNRNHLILTEPETVTLHRLFDQYLFDVTMDVHEYYPYGETWKKYGYRNNSDELLGAATNINVSEKLRRLSNESFLPFMKKFFDDRNISNFIYSPGGPPEQDYIRHSTFDINDGRQSFAILNTFSFIQEGINGKDLVTDNIKHRAEGQMTGMRGLLEYAYINHRIIKKTVAAERKKLIRGTAGTTVSIQNEHVKNGQTLPLPLYSYYSGTDTVVNVTDYRPVVRSLHDVSKPCGYLIPKELKDVTEWVERHALVTENFTGGGRFGIEQYDVSAIDSIDFEGDIIVNPEVTSREQDVKINFSDYVYVPSTQLKGNMIVIALEPRSMLGLVTYPGFAHLLRAGEKFPVLRVIRK
jgi:hypothetical protein